MPDMIKTTQKLTLVRWVAEQQIYMTLMDLGSLKMAEVTFAPLQLFFLHLQWKQKITLGIILVQKKIISLASWPY